MTTSVQIETPVRSGESKLGRRVETRGWAAPAVDTRSTRWPERVRESVPGVVSWLVLLAPIWLTVIHPQAGEFFIFVATIYFAAKATWYGIRAVRNRRLVLQSMREDWLAKLRAECASQNIDLKAYRITLMIRAYRESNVEMLRQTLNSIYASNWPRHGERLAQVEVLFATEENDPITPPIVRLLADEFEPRLRVRQIIHPHEPGTLPGPSTAMHYVGRRLHREISATGMSPRRWLIADFDCDTIFNAQYLPCLMYHFIRDPQRDMRAYQPVVLFTTSYWQAPLHSRLAALATSVLTLSWIRRPEIAFTGAAASLELLHSVDYWPTNSHSQDSGIETRLQMRHGRRFKVVGLPIPLSVYPVMLVGATSTGKERIRAYANSFRALFRQSARWREGPLDEFIEAMRAWHLPLTFAKLWNGLERDVLALMPIIGFTLARGTQSILNPNCAGPCFASLASEFPTSIVAAVLSLVGLMGITVFGLLLDTDELIQGGPTATRRLFELGLFWLVFSLYMPLLTAIAGLRTSTAYLLGRRPRGHFMPTPK